MSSPCGFSTSWIHRVQDSPSLSSATFSETQHVLRNKIGWVSQPQHDGNNMMENVRFLLSHVTSMSMIELWSYHDYPPVMYEFAMEAMAQMTKMMIYGTNKWYQMVMFVLSNHRVYVRANTSFRPTSPLGLRFYGLRSRVLAFSCFAFRVFPWFCHCLLMFLEFKVEGLRF